VNCVYVLTLKYDLLLASKSIIKSKLNLKFLSILFIKLIIKSSLASPFGSTKRKRWTQEETQLILTSFHQEIKKSQLSSGTDIEMLRQKHTCLHTRTTPQIKTWIHNIINGKMPHI